MAVPAVKTTDFKAILPTGSDTICQLLVKFIRFVVLWYRWYSYAFDSDGKITASYRGELCNVISKCTATT